MALSRVWTAFLTYSHQITAGHNAAAMGANTQMRALYHTATKPSAFLTHKDHITVSQNPAAVAADTQMRALYHVATKPSAAGTGPECLARSEQPACLTFASNVAVWSSLPRLKQASSDATCSLIVCRRVCTVSSLGNACHATSAVVFNCIMVQQCHQDCCISAACDARPGTVQNRPASCQG